MAVKRELIAPKGEKRFIRRDAKGRIRRALHGVGSDGEQCATSRHPASATPAAAIT